MLPLLQRLHETHVILPATIVSPVLLPLLGGGFLTGTGSPHVTIRGVFFLGNDWDTTNTGKQSLFVLGIGDLNEHVLEARFFMVVPRGF